MILTKTTTTLSLAAACCLILIGSTSANADLITAQHAYSDQTNGVFNGGAGMATDGPEVFDNRQAQTFTANITGALEQISFTASRLSGTNADLRVSLMTLENNQPASVLATSLVDFNSFDEGFLSSPADFTHTINFDPFSSAVLNQGESYAIVFSTDSTEANYRIYGDDVGYSGGSSMFSQNGSPFTLRSGDLYFQVGVVPAPASLFALTLLAIPRRRR